MALDGNRITALILGGMFMAAWLYFALFVEDTWGAWVGWGVLGIVLAAALFVGRFASEAIQVGTWIALGMSLAFILLAAIAEEESAILATALTFAGGALITAGLPTRQGWVPAQEGPPQPGNR